ncbi:MAG: Fe-S cluster assembly iron-binding protein IscA [Phycisphaerales bacterium]|jgi:Fe-S cluster assembly iron-binding protein IscA
MLTVTDDAKSHLAEIITNNELSEDASIRLVTGPNGIGLAPDAPKPEDDTYEHAGRTVLVVDPALSAQLDDKTMSIEKSEAGEKLSIG